MKQIVTRGKTIHIHLDYKVDNQNDLLKVNLAEGNVTIRLESGKRLTLPLRYVKGQLILTQPTYGRLIEDGDVKQFVTDF